MKKIALIGLLALGLVASVFAKAKEPQWVEADVAVNTENERGSFKTDESRWIEFKQNGLSGNLLLNGDRGTDYLGFEAACKVVAGDEKASVGFTFCQEGGMSDGIFYDIMLRENGTFQVRKNKKAILEWTSSDAIKKGFGEENIVRVQQNGKAKEIYINDTLVHTIEKAGSKKGKVQFMGLCSKTKEVTLQAKFLRFQK